MHSPGSTVASRENKSVSEHRMLNIHPSPVKRPTTRHGLVWDTSSPLLANGVTPPTNDGKREWVGGGVVSPDVYSCLRQLTSTNPFTLDQLVKAPVIGR